MGTGEALHGFQLRPMMALLVLLELAVDRQSRGCGVAHGRNRLITQGQLLPAAGKGIVMPPRLFFQTAKIFCPGGNQNCTGLRHALVVVRQQLQHFRSIHALVQGGGLLGQQASIFLQRPGVLRPKLAQGVIHQLAPLRRSLFQNHKILRAEQHGIQNPVQSLPGGLFNPGKEKLPGPSSGKHHSPKTLLPPIGFHPCTELGKISSKADQLRLPPGAKGCPPAEITDCLQKIRFSLGVLPYKQVDPRRKLTLNAFVIAEAPQA